MSIEKFKQIYAIFVITHGNLRNTVFSYKIPKAVLKKATCNFIQCFVSRRCKLRLESFKSNDCSNLRNFYCAGFQL